MPNLKYVIKRAMHMDYKAMISKINHIHKITGKSRIYIFNDMRKCATLYGAGYMDYDLFEMYNLTKEQRDTYITRGRNDELVKKYNDKAYCHIFSNKLEFNQTFKKYIKRDFLEVKASSKDDILKFIKKHPIFFAKPIDGTHGDGIYKINVQEYNNQEEVIEKIMNLNGNYLLEESAEQCEAVNNIYSGSVNTVRFVTILDDKNIPHVICTYFRIGNGKHVDNFNNGGMVTPVDEKTGIVIDKAIDKKKNLYERHPITNTTIKGFQFPDWDKAIKLVCDAAKVIPQIRYIGWDVCFSKKGPLIIEGNDYPGHDIYQLPEHTHNKKGIWEKFIKGLE